MIPGAPGWSAPKLTALWRGAPFYVASESRPWFAAGAGPGRLAGLNLIGRGGSFAHLILTEPQDRPSASNTALAFGGAYLFPLVGDSLEDLTDALRDLQQALLFSSDPARLAAERFEEARANGPAQFGISIVGREPGEIAREIDLAINALPQAFEKGIEWQTPLGSCCAPSPVGELGEIALVYPGAFNSYPGVGKDLFWLFPALFERMGEVTANIGAVMRERLLYPRSLAALTKEDLSAREAALLADPVAMLNSGTALAILYTHILTGVFGVRPGAAFGYSLGETSMMYATGVWRQGDQAAARLAESEAFRVRLAGPQNAVRAHWGLPEAGAPGEAPLWSNYLVMAAPDRVRAALQDEPRVYMTHVNTPRQVVIGGDPAACQRVIAFLRCSALQAPFDYALHCEAMRSEFDALADLHDWPVEQAPGLRMYSAADYTMIPTPYERSAVSRKIARMLTEPLDFPRLIQTVYADGARVFIEAGAGSNCARWIDETLKGQPHLAISMNRRGTDDHASLLRTLARLHAHRVKVDLSALYQPILEKVNA
jgi:PfaB family protein